VPLAAVENQIALQLAAEERERRRELAKIQADEDRLADAAADQKRDAATGPAALLDSLTGGKRVAIAGNVQRAAEEDRFLNEQATRRLERRATGLADRKRDVAANPAPTRDELYQTTTAPLGRFAHEAPTREDLPELEAMKQRILGGAGGAGPREPAAADRFYYREEPTGSLSFTNRPERAAEPGFRRYNADSGTQKDLGAPGGGLAHIGSGRGTALPQAALLQDLEGLIRRTEREPLTAAETMGAVAEARSDWDVRAANIADPNQIEQAILSAAGRKELPPEVAEDLLRRYTGIARQVTKAEDGEFNPRAFQEILQPSALAGPPVPRPGEAEARLRAGGEAIPAQLAREQETVTQAVQAPPDAVGTAASPAMAAEGATDPAEVKRSILGLRPQRQTQRVGGRELGYEIGGDFIPEGMGGEAGPPWLAGLPEDLRLLMAGAQFAAGGRESAAERRRRLTRERG
jgi:hypothetical protein